MTNSAFGFIEPRNVVFLGKTGTGKSTAAVCYLRRLTRPLIIIVHERRDEPYYQFLPQGDIQFISVDNSAFMIRPETLERVRTGGHRYLYFTLEHVSRRNTQAFLESLARSLMETGNAGLMIEEAHQLCKRTNAPTEFITFTRSARTYGVDLAFASHRFVDIDPDIRTNFTHCAVFQMARKIDRDAIADEFEAGDDFAEKIRLLPLRRFHWLATNRGFVGPETGINPQ